jgi:peptidoglycan/LPS O-acetylase OafA/YrhL
MSGSRTLHTELEASGGRPSGFDYLRLLLAVMVVALHSVIVSYGQLLEIAFWSSPARPIVRFVLPMFFTLSGFLVAGSLVRSRSLGMFLSLRVIRIFPALSTEVFLSALVLGPLFTVLPLSAYFSSPEFAVYFWNVVGHVHLTLPGVYVANPYPRIINGQLWTVPYELYCYLLLGALSLIGVARRRILAFVGGFVVTAAYLAFKLARDGYFPAQTIGPIPGAMLVVCFLFGVGFYLYKDKVPHNAELAGATAVVAGLLVTAVPYGEYVAPIFVSYLTVYLGLLSPRRTFFVEGADYSYGLFLYGYPIQQALAAISPVFHSWALNFGGTIALGLVFASMSWRYIERPALRLRTPLLSIEDHWIRWRCRREAMKRAWSATTAAERLPDSDETRIVARARARLFPPSSDRTNVPR